MALNAFQTMVKSEPLVHFFRLYPLEFQLNTLTVTSPVVYCYVTNQTVSSCPCSHETKYSFLCRLILYHPCEHFLMIPPYPLEFVRLLIYSTAVSSELTGIASTVLLLSSASLGNSVNSSFVYFIFSCVRGAGTPLLIC